jgi:trans-aconitate methyltransferase
MTDTRTEHDPWNASGYETHAGFVADLGTPVLDLLDPKPGERVLDLGCGDGRLTKALAERGARVVGVDASADMVRAAKTLGCEAHVQTGEALDLPQKFEAVFSNAALHWMPRADAVAARVFAHLEPGGRFVGEFGGHGNVAAIVTALLAACEAQGVALPEPWPWAFPTPEAYKTLLEAAGFAEVECRLLPRPTPLPTGMAGWLDTFAWPFTQALEPQAKAALLARTEALLAPALRAADGRWTADYVRLRFRAQKPG